MKYALHVEVIADEGFERSLRKALQRLDPSCKTFIDCSANLVEIDSNLPRDLIEQALRDEGARILLR